MAHGNGNARPAENLRHAPCVPDLTAPVVRAGRLGGRPQPRLAAGGLVLRPFAEADVPGLVAAYGDPAIQQWHARSMTEDEARAWVAAREGRWGAESGGDWAVTDGGALVARVGLRTLSLAEGWAEAAYWVVPAARGRGVAARALDAVAAWLFDDVGLHRLELVHAVGNVASCRVAAKAGFRLEGTKRRQTLHPDGWHDMHLHARLAADAAQSPNGPAGNQTSFSGSPEVR